MPKKKFTFKKVSLSKHFVREIARASLPFVVLPLVRKGIITAEHLKDARALIGVITKHLRTTLKEIEWCAAMDSQFLAESIKCWSRKRQEIAIVLYATAVEQYCNQMYQLILAAQGWEKEHVTHLLRKMDIRGKLSWMFERFTNRRFPPRLQRRLIKVADIRNGIIHFKGEIAHPDREQDSYSKIQRELKTLHRMSISRDFRLLEETFTAGLLSVDPDREVVLQVVDVINSHLAEGVNP